MADIDNDGDMDLLGGDDWGYIKIFERLDNGDLTFAGNLNADGEELNVGERAAPEWVDWDLDGDFDLLVGAADGNVHLYLNQGTLEEPEFTFDGKIQADGEDIWVGTESAPAYADLDGDGARDLVVGSIFARLMFYRNAGSNENPEFAAGVPLNDENGQINLMQYSRPELFDWDLDGDMDIISGLVDPQVKLFINPGGESVDDWDRGVVQSFAFAGSYPEPFNAKTNLTFYTDKPSRCSLSVFSASGQFLFEKDFDSGNAGMHSIPLDFMGFSAGKYIVNLSSGNRTISKTVTLVR